MFSPALLAYASERMRASWRQRRKEEMPAEELERGMQSFCKGVLELPGNIGAWRARDRTEWESMTAEGEAFRALQKLEADPQGPHLELVEDRERFAELFTPGVRGSSVDGVSSLGRVREAVRDGTTLTFPAGVFRLRDLLSTNAPFPRDVTVQGAGMDATLLLAGGLHCSGPLRNLTLADCTIFSNCDLIDQRSTPAALRFLRVRVIGFDCGAGASSALCTDAATLLVEECRFEGATGGAPVPAT